MTFSVTCIIYAISHLILNACCQEVTVCNQMNLKKYNQDETNDQCVGQTVFVHETEKQKGNPGEKGKPGNKRPRGDKGETGSINVTEIQTIVNKGLLNQSNMIQTIQTNLESKCYSYFKYVLSTL